MWFTGRLNICSNAIKNPYGAIQPLDIPEDPIFGRYLVSMHICGQPQAREELESQTAFLWHGKLHKHYKTRNYPSETKQRDRSCILHS